MPHRQRARRFRQDCEEARYHPEEDEQLLDKLEELLSQNKELRERITALETTQNKATEEMEQNADTL